MKTALAFVVAVGTILGCAAEDPPQSSQSPHVEFPGNPVAVSEIRLNQAPPPASAHVFYSGYAEPAALIIRSQGEWASAFAKIYEGVHPLPVLPVVDFDTDMVVLAATGTRESGGFDIAVTDAALDAGTLRVGVVETTPGADCIVAAVITQPVAAAGLPRHDGAVEFVNATVAMRCE